MSFSCFPLQRTELCCISEVRASSVFHDDGDDDDYDDDDDEPS